MGLVRRPMSQHVQRALSAYVTVHALFCLLSEMRGEAAFRMDVRNKGRMLAQTSLVLQRF